MTKVVAIGFLVAGIVLTVFGVQAMNSASSSISKVFSGTPTDKSMEMLIFGIVGIVLGMAGLLFTRRGQNG